MMGNTIRGMILADNAPAARADLRRQNIVATKIRKQRSLFAGGGKISPSDIAIFSRQLATMLAAGVPDYRLETVPSLYRELLADEQSLLIDQEKGLTTGEWRQIQGMTSRLEHLCLQLTGYGIPESINHGDFHDGNVLVRDGRVTFLDWADACISHPFMSLRTFFVSIEIALKLDDYAPPTPEMSALLDRYLEQWQSFASLTALRSAYLISRPVASIVKAANWHLTISNIGDTALRGKYAWIVPELFREFVVYEKMLPN